MVLSPTFSRGPVCMKCTKWRQHFGAIRNLRRGMFSLIFLDELRTAVLLSLKKHYFTFSSIMERLALQNGGLSPISEIYFLLSELQSESKRY